MEIKFVVKRTAVTFIIIIVSYILQTSIFPHLALAGVVPNFLVLITTSFGLMNGSKQGMAVGFTCGLITDFYSGTYLGIYVLIFLYIGFISGLFKRVFYGEDIKLPLVLIAASDLIYGLGIYVIMFLFRRQFSFGYYLFHVIIPEAVYTVLISIVGYYIILRINQWLEKDKSRSGRSLV